MSYMKEEWLKREQARAEADLERMNWKDFDREYVGTSASGSPTPEVGPSSQKKRCVKCGEESNVFTGCPEWWCSTCGWVNVASDQERLVTVASILSKVLDGPTGAEIVADLANKAQRGGSETDKVEGTRDVEKFLKEQQAALWRGE